MKTDFDIDFVVPWVDGADPAWLKEKKKYSPETTDDSNSINRYRDWGLMSFWFRAVEKFAPWVRKVHFVTWGHLPDFMNVNTPQLHIINHHDFIPQKYLPVFSSIPIELNLHRINDLAEHFVYFNDDTFLLRTMKPDDFFEPKTGYPRTQATLIPFCFVEQNTWEYNAVNDLFVLNKYYDMRRIVMKNLSKFINFKYHFYDNIRTLCMSFLFSSKFYGFKNFHAPAAYLKTTFQTLWEKEPELLHETSCHRFRSKEDVNQWLALWWQVASGKFFPRRMNTLTFAPTINNYQKLANTIQWQKKEMVCINDPDKDNDIEFLKREIIAAFDKILPEKSSFEK